MSMRICKSPFSTLLAIVILFGAGCEQPSQDIPDGASAESEQTQEPESNADETPSDEPKDTGTGVTAELASYDDVMAFVASAKGKVVVVDVWSTSCLPCMQEFPNLVALSKQYPQRVQCVSLNVDYIGLKKKGPETYLPAVEKFLIAQDAQLKNFVATEMDEAIRERLSIGAIPAIIVYSPDGELAGTLTDSNASGDGLSYEGDVIPLVEKLLASE